MRRNCYFRATGENSDLAIQRPPFPEREQKSAMRRHFQVFFSTYRSKIWHISISSLFDLMFSNISHMLRFALW